MFYFLAGYLLYSSLMGAIGAAVDNDEDSQQMIFPVTFPLILSIMVLFSIARNPEGSVAFWFSIIPFTSPVVMLARVPYGVPTWELLLSMGLISPVDAVMERNPDLTTREDAMAYLLAVRDETAALNETKI